MPTELDEWADKLATLGEEGYEHCLSWLFGRVLALHPEIIEQAYGATLLWLAEWESDDEPD